MNDICAIFWVIKGKIQVIKNDANEQDKVEQQNTDKNGMRHFHGGNVSFLLISSPVFTSQSPL